MCIYWSLAVIMHNFTASLAVNNIVKVASIAGFQGSHTFPCRSLLLSTSVLDDTGRSPCKNTITDTIINIHEELLQIFLTAACS